MPIVSDWFAFDKENFRRCISAIRGLANHLLLHQAFHIRIVRPEPFQHGFIPRAVKILAALLVGVDV
jgi:hypothetical protein